VNEALTDSPEIVNQDPYGDGWFFKLTPTDPADLDELLDAGGYAEVCADED
jgi:glycine cleavage system H protein